MFLTYRYRLLPTKARHRALEAILESQRELYNAALQERIDAYRKAGISRSLFDQNRALTEWRQADPDARALLRRIQRATLERLDRAYQAFFRRLRRGQKPGFPRFRGKGWFDSFAISGFQGIAWRAGRLRFKGMPGALRVHMHRPLPKDGVIKRCTFRRDAKGWTAGFALELPCAPSRESNRAVGVDLGITTFASLSDGGSIPSLRAARTAARRLRLAQRALSRKMPRSRGRQKARSGVRRCHESIARQRMNHLHQASARLVHAYDLIAVESLRIKSLAESVLAKDVRDASWGTFILLLRYKAAKAGARVVEVDAHNTSQDCSACGMDVPKNLHERRHQCPHCGLSIDRDLNAARNILHRAGVGPGLRNVAGCGMRAGGNLDPTAADSPPNANQDTSNLLLYR